MQAIDVGQDDHGSVHRLLGGPPRDPEPGCDTGDGPPVVDNRLQHAPPQAGRAPGRSGNSGVVWVNVRRGHARSAHTILGFTTITSNLPAFGTSLTRCRHQAWTRCDTTPQSGQPSPIVSARTITRRPPKGRSTASITW